MSLITNVTTPIVIQFPDATQIGANGLPIASGPATTSQYGGVPPLLPPGTGSGQQMSVLLRGDDTWQPISNVLNYINLSLTNTNTSLSFDCTGYTAVELRLGFTGVNPGSFTISLNNLRSGVSTMVKIFSNGSGSISPVKINATDRDGNSATCMA